jgi:hypothetical protein
MHYVGATTGRQDPVDAATEYFGSRSMPDAVSSCAQSSRPAGQLVAGTLGIPLGDINFDRFFDINDLQSLLATSQYEDDATNNSTWTTGDWNGDRDFTSLDLVLAFQFGQSQEGFRTAEMPYEFDQLRR